MATGPTQAAPTGRGGGAAARSATRERRRADAGATSPTTMDSLSSNHRSLITTHMLTCTASFHTKFDPQNAANLVSIRRGGVKCTIKVNENEKNDIMYKHIMV